MYTTPADAPGAPWNNGNTPGRVSTGRTSTVTGASNTAALLGIDSDSSAAGFQPHLAARTCGQLFVHEKSDWYVPATSELSVLYANATAIGGFTSGRYWTSTEQGQNDSRIVIFSDGGVSGWSKNAANNVRCVRKGYVPSCINPMHEDGAVIYNTWFNRLQYCDPYSGGDGWRSMDR
ncbi:DUF1566 domain-containing protein [Histidinibacterium lentulum]|uniref:DUF1566 domain-containing protein n=2 Tax=Histidinibacterium lentulum TaxID=2480588 RepID=A0A3N2QEQ2_9RHOB|nr:DUF1566 domain-containing protein [Histidinibacterium lentulum]